MPFVPEEKPRAVPEISFSCIVDPPAKRGRTKSERDQPAAVPVRSVVPTAPLRTDPGAPTVVPNPALIAPRGKTESAPAATPMGTMPPFAQGGTTAPFATSASEVPFEFNAPKRERVRWLSWSTLLLVAGCAAGYFQYQRMQRAAEATPPAVIIAPAAEQNATGAQQPSSFATPFTALKQAKETIKDAGEKHRASYELVEKMLDDPNAAVDVAPKPATPPIAVVASTPEPAAPAKRDAVTALLGSDGEFFVPPSSPKPSLVFARWVRRVKIGGARLSDRPRVLVGAGAFTFGDVVEFNLGIVLEGYNAERRALQFKETSTGAVIERRL